MSSHDNFEVYASTQLDDEHTHGEDDEGDHEEVLCTLREDMLESAFSSAGRDDTGQSNIECLEKKYAISRSQVDEGGGSGDVVGLGVGMDSLQAAKKESIFDVIGDGHKADNGASLAILSRRNGGVRAILGECDVELGFTPSQSQVSNRVGDSYAVGLDFEIDSDRVEHQVSCGKDIRATSPSSQGTMRRPRGESDVALGFTPSQTQIVDIELGISDVAVVDMVRMDEEDEAQLVIKNKQNQVPRDEKNIAHVEEDEEEMDRISAKNGEGNDNTDNLNVVIKEASHDKLIAPPLLHGTETKRQRGGSDIELGFTPSQTQVIGNDVGDSEMEVAYVADVVQVAEIQHVVQTAEEENGVSKKIDANEDDNVVEGADDRDILCLRDAGMKRPRESDAGIGFTLSKSQVVDNREVIMIDEISVEAINNLSDDGDDDSHGDVEDIDEIRTSGVVDCAYQCTKMKRQRGESDVELGFTPSQTLVLGSVCVVETVGNAIVQANEEEKEVIEKIDANEDDIELPGSDKGDILSLRHVGIKRPREECDIELGFTPSQSQVGEVETIDEAQVEEEEEEEEEKKEGEIKDVEGVGENMGKVFVADESVSQSWRHAGVCEKSIGAMRTNSAQSHVSQESVGDQEKFIFLTACTESQSQMQCLSEDQTTKQISQSTVRVGESIKVNKSDSILNDDHRIFDKTNLIVNSGKERGNMMKDVNENMQLSPGWIESKNILRVQEAIPCDESVPTAKCQGLICSDANEVCSNGTGCGSSVVSGHSSSASTMFANTSCPTSTTKICGMQDHTVAEEGVANITELQQAREQLAALQAQMKEKDAEISRLRNYEKCMDFNAAPSTTIGEGELSQSTEMVTTCLLKLKDCNTVNRNVPKGFWSNLSLSEKSAHKAHLPTGQNNEDDDSSTDIFIPRKKKSRLVRKKQDFSTTLTIDIDKNIDDAMKCSPPLSHDTVNQSKIDITAIDTRNTALSPKSLPDNKEMSPLGCDFGGSPSSLLPRALRTSEKKIRSMKWSHIWKELKNMKWTLSKGKGLDDYYYYRPDRRDTSRSQQPASFSGTMNMIEGVPYFKRQSDVVDFVVKKAGEYDRDKNVVHECSDEHGQSSSESESEFSVGTQIEEVDDSTEPFNKSPKGGNTLLSRSNEKTESVLVETWMNDIPKMKWPDIWSRLQDDGWSWDHGSGLVTTYYLMPGITSKRYGTSGVDMFSSEDEVKTFLLRQVPQTRRSIPVAIRDSDNSGSALTEWSLAAHRMKRVFSPSGVAMDSSGASKSSTSSSATPSKMKQTSGNRTAKCRSSSKKVSIDNLLASPRRTKQVPRPTPEVPVSSIERRNKSKNVAVTPSPCVDGDADRKARSHHIVLSNTKKLFAGLSFLITGLEGHDSESMSGMPTIFRLITDNGGIVLEEEKDLLSCVSGKKVKRPDTILIAAPAAFRRPKFLAALSLGVPILHPKWVQYSLNQSILLPRADYSLPAGSSPLHPYFVFRDNSSVNDEEGATLAVFDSNLLFLNLATPMWDGLLMNSGAKLCCGSPSSVVAYRKILMGMDDRDFDKLPAFIVVDSYMYSEGELSHSIVDFLHTCQSILNSRISRLSRKGKLRVVTTEWVAFCLRLGEYVDPSTSPSFCLPRDPARHPLVTKTAPVGACLGAIKGVGGTRSKRDRFVVGDIVSYDTGESGGMSNPSYTTIAYARIFEFFRKDRSSKVSVRLQPLKRDSGQEISLSGTATCFKIIARTSLRGRLTVFSSRAYQLLPYAREDETIFFSSLEWEETSALEQKVAIDNTNDEVVSISKIKPSRSIKAQLSQDY